VLVSVAGCKADHRLAFLGIRAVRGLLREDDYHGAKYRARYSAPSIMQPVKERVRPSPIVRLHRMLLRIPYLWIKRRFIPHNARDLRATRISAA
jgi:hypothetical protein